MTIISFPNHREFNNIVAMLIIAKIKKVCRSFTALDNIVKKNTAAKICHINALFLPKKYNVSAVVLNEPSIPSGLIKKLSTLVASIHHFGERKDLLVNNSKIKMVIKKYKNKNLKSNVFLSMIKLYLRCFFSLFDKCIFFCIIDRENAHVIKYINIVNNGLEYILFNIIVAIDDINTIKRRV